MNEELKKRCTVYYRGENRDGWPHGYVQVGIFAQRGLEVARGLKPEDDWSELPQAVVTGYQVGKLHWGDVIVDSDGRIFFLSEDESGWVEQPKPPRPSRDIVASGHWLAHFGKEEASEPTAVASTGPIEEFPTTFKPWVAGGMLTFPWLEGPIQCSFEGSTAHHTAMILVTLIAAHPDGTWEQALDVMDSLGMSGLVDENGVVVFSTTEHRG